MFEPSTRQSRLDAKTAAAARFLIFPTGTFRTCWDVMLVILVVYNAFSLPFVVCFEVELLPAMVVLDQVIDAIFYLDLILNFLTTYEVKGHLVLDVKTVIWHYLTNWFIVDLIATFPFEVLTGDGYGSSHQFKVSLLRGLKCVRLIRLARLFKFLEKIEFVNGFLKMLRLFFGFSIVAHWLACLWYLIGRLSLTWDSSTPQGWMVFYNASGWDVYQKTHVSSYITSLYWTITTLLTVGYGDISAHTNLEKMFAVLTMVFGALISATIFGNVTMLIESLGRSEAMYREKMEAVQYYMNDLDLPDTMQHRIRDFYTLLWNRNKSFGGENILAELPPSFHHEIAGFLNQDLFDKSMIFIDGDPYFLRNLASRLKFCVSLPNDDIFREEEPSDKIYFIRKGSVQISSEAAGKLTVMKEGNYFGEIGLMMKEFYEEFGLGDNKANVPFIPSLDAEGQEINKKEAAAAASSSTTVPNKRTASVMALVNCDLYFLSEEDFYGLIDHYPQYHRLFLLIALVRFKQIDYHDDEDIIQKIFITQVRRKELRLKYHRKEKPKKQSIIATKKGAKAKSVLEIENVDAAPVVDTFEETTKELIRRVSLIGLDADAQAALKLKHAALGFVSRAAVPVDATPKPETTPAASPSGTMAAMPAFALPPSVVPEPTPSPSSTSVSISSPSASASDSAASATTTATTAGSTTSSNATASSLAEGLTKDENEPGATAQKIPPKPDSVSLLTVAEIPATTTAAESVPPVAVDSAAATTAAEPASPSSPASSPSSPASSSTSPTSPSAAAKAALIRARSFDPMPLLREETDEEDESSRSAAAAAVGLRTPSVASPLGSPRKQQTGNNTPVGTPSTPRDRVTTAASPPSAGSSTASSPPSTTQSTPVLAPASKLFSATTAAPTTTASSSSSLVDEIKASPRAPATAIRETRRVPIPANLVTAATPAASSSTATTTIAVDKSTPARIIANLPSTIVPSAAAARIMSSSSSSSTASSATSSPKIGAITDSPKPQTVPYPFAPSASSASSPPLAGRTISTSAATTAAAASSIPTPTASSRPTSAAAAPSVSSTTVAAAPSVVRSPILSNAIASAATLGGTSSQPQVRPSGPIRPAIIEAVSKTDPEFASLLQRASALASTSPSSAKYVSAAAQSSAARAATSPVRSPMRPAASLSPLSPIPVPSMAPPPPPASTPPAPASIVGVDDPMSLSRHSLSSSSHRSEGHKRTTPSLSREPSGGPGAPSISRSSSSGTNPSQRGSHSNKSEPDHGRGSSDESDEGAPLVGVQAAATSASASGAAGAAKAANLLPPVSSTPSPIPPYTPAVQQMTAASSSQLQSPGRSPASPLSAREGLRQFLHGGPSAGSASSSAFTRYPLSPPPPPVGTSSSSSQARSPLSPSAFQSPVRSPPPAAGSSTAASPSSMIASTPPPAVKPWIQFLNRPSPASTASRSATVTPARLTVHPMPAAAAASGSAASSSTASSSSSSTDSNKLFTPRKQADQK